MFIDEVAYRVGMLACSAMGNVAGVALLGGLGGPARPDHAFEQLHTQLHFFTVPHAASIHAIRIKFAFPHMHAVV